MAWSGNDQQLWNQFTNTVQPLKGVKPLPVCVHVPKFQVSQPHTPSHTLDLHGMTLQQAYQAVQDHVIYGKLTYAYVTIITGKSGIMHAQLPDWIANMTHIRACEPINGGGAYKISFKKTRLTK